jgi:xanthine/uracil permease
MNAWRLLAAQWPVVLVGLVFVAAFTLAGENFWRRGALLIGMAVGVAAMLRLALPERRAGLLVLRSKGIDFATMGVLATAMVYIAWTIDPLGTG